MGPPGVGKGTQGQRLSAAYDVPVIASGDMFRRVRVEESPRAREIQAYMDRGDMVPDEMTIEMVLDRLKKPDARGGFILDGFPRTIAQAVALDADLANQERPIEHVVLLQAPADVILARLAGRRVCDSCSKVYNVDSNPARVDGVCDVCGGNVIQRTDEAPEVQRRRLEVYEEQTAAVASYYRSSGRLTVVDATLALDAVQAELHQLLGAAVAR
jgi:adenylate kinase